MDDFKKILLLDDDSRHLEILSEAIETCGHVTVSALDVPTAVRSLELGIDFAIVDLFLAGDDGDELSNGFVTDYLIARGIPYCRMSSAPGLVPMELSGYGIFDKRQFHRAPRIFLDLLCSDWLTRK